MKSEKTRLLIVDDSVLIQKMLKGAIERISGSGFNSNIKVLQAINCYEARSLYKCTHPDVVILDLSLPDGSGLNLLNEFRNEPGIITPATILIFSNLSSSEIRNHCLNAGANGFFDKADFNSFISYLTQEINSINQNTKTNN